MSILDKSSYTVGNEEVYAIISGIKGPHVDEDKSINIAAHVLKDLWLSDVSSNQKQFILDAILFDFCLERSMDIVIRKLHKQLQILLIMAPKQLMDKLFKLRTMGCHCETVSPSKQFPYGGGGCHVGLRLTPVTLFVRFLFVISIRELSELIDLFYGVRKRLM